LNLLSQDALPLEPTLWADVEDLFDYARSNPRPSGVQRVAFAILGSLRSRLSGTDRLRFVRHAGRKAVPLLQEIPWSEVEELFARLRDPPDGSPAMRGRSHPSVSLRHAPKLLAARHWLGRIAYRMPAELRDPLLRAWFLQRDAARELVAPLRARRKQPPSAPLRSQPKQGFGIREGDMFLVLGAPWVHADFGSLLRALREDHGMRIGLLLHDLIPAVRPEWCTRDLVKGFRAWLVATLPQCDLLLSNSRFTAKEVEGWALREGLRLSGAVHPIPIGTGFEIETEPAWLRPLGLPRAGSYVLFVSTLEVRKNHALLVRVWRELLEEEQLGLRPRGSVPGLVFAGRVGWLVSDLIEQLESASWLENRVRLLRDPSDAELRALYEGCLFSVFPSWHEGWGLPVTEALGLGVPVLCSSAGALPEAGGTLARYFDPGDTRGCREAVAALLDDREALAAWRAEIRARFRPTPWSATAKAILDAVPGVQANVPEETAG